MTGETLTAAVDYTRGEIVRAKLHLYARRTRLWWGLAIILIIVFNPFWPNTTDPLTYWREDTLGFLLFTISVMWPPIGLIGVIRAAQRTHATQLALKAEISFTLDDGGLTMHGKGSTDGEPWESEQRTQWAQLQTLRDIGWGYLFIRADKHYHLIPRRCLQDPQAWHAKLVSAAPADKRNF
jgi:hypothetical protein